MKRALTIALLIGLTAGVAWATTKVLVDATCPVCETKFQGASAASSNNFGGQDRDFLTHAAGGQPFLFSCWTCPKCNYTGFSDDFKPGAVDDALKKQILEGKALVPRQKIDPAQTRSDRIPAFVRYDLYVQTQALKKAKQLDQGWACLRTAQTVRFQRVALKGVTEERTKALYARVNARGRGYLSAVGVAYDLAKLADDEDSKLSDADRDLARVLAARLYFGRGESVDARRLLEPLVGEGKATAPALQEVAKQLLTLIAREVAYNTRAAAHFRKAIADGELKGEGLKNHRYLLGELLRKSGKTEEAVKHLEAMVAEGDAHAGRKQWTEEALARAKGRAAGAPQERPKEK